IGAGCAYELAGAGLQVTVIERVEPGAEASGASAGMLSAFTSERAGPVGALYRLSRDLYAPLAEALRAESGVDIEHGRAGHLELCMAEDEVRWARKFVSEHADGGERLEFVTAEELRRLEPEVTREAKGAVFLPGNEWVNNERLVVALVQAAARRGARFFLGHPVEEILATGSRVTGVRARGLGSLSAGAVLLAAGTWSGEIAGVPASLRLRPVKGQMIALANTPPLIHHALLRDELYLVPRAGGECLVGATVEEGVFDKRVTPEALQWLLSGAVATVPGFARVAFRRAWAGLRPATEDGLPVIGPWPGLTGLLVAAGHFRSGILLMPVTARIIREWLVDGHCSLPAEAFLPDRLALA
ncbi:MAG: glycine oxidase ThiO, partial [Candidatus Rokuibacteriota bacterium]